ncbi:MAG: hypothetical protein WBK97_04305 [Bacteroidales bacterium]
MRNVNVFVDGNIYSELLEQMIEEEREWADGYSLYPVFEGKIFHPKIWCFFGNQEGLLIVGSGNLTQSGCGNNDEIWGAFHYRKGEQSNAELFSAAWNYIYKLSSGTKGTVKTKTTDWILGNAQWIEELPQVEDFQFSDVGKEQVAFLYNSVKTTIWKEVKQRLFHENITVVTSISPFYDKDGKALEEIKNTFPNAIIQVLLDEEGVIPSEMINSKGFLFYAWRDLEVCRKIGEKHYSKLHAKILHFKTNSNKEYCLFGSANITSAGLGLSDNVNSEVSLFIKSEQGNILDKLGLNFKDSIIKQLNDFSSGERPISMHAMNTRNRFLIKLLLAEKETGILNLFFEGSYDKEATAILYDFSSSVLSSKTIQLIESQIEISIGNEAKDLKYVQLFNKNDGGILSNKIIVTDFFTISRTRPNLQDVQFEKICELIENNELGIIPSLLGYVLDDEMERGFFSISGRRKRDEEEANTNASATYDLSLYNQSNRNLRIKENVLHYSKSLRALSVVKTVYKEIDVIEDDINSDEQNEDISHLEGKDESQQNVSERFSLAVLKSDRGYLIRYLDRIFKYFQQSLFIENTEEDYSITISDLAKYLIAIELINIYGGKKEKIEDLEQQSYFNYLELSGSYDGKNVKAYCMGIVGTFLLLVSRRGFKKYSTAYWQEEFKRLKHDAVITTTACIINTDWLEKEFHYFKSLLFNTLHYFREFSIRDIDKDISLLIEDVKKKTKELKQPIRKLDDQFSFFETNVCPAFVKVLERIESKNFSKKAREGNMIYSSVANIGYCTVVSVTENNKYILARPGFIWDKKRKEFISHFGDNIYTPLTLLSMVIVD